MHFCLHSNQKVIFFSIPGCNVNPIHGCAIMQPFQKLKDTEASPWAGLYISTRLTNKSICHSNMKHLRHHKDTTSWQEYCSCNLVRLQLKCQGCSFLCATDAITQQNCGEVFFSHKNITSDWFQRVFPKRLKCLIFQTKWPNQWATTSRTLYRVFFLHHQHSSACAQLTKTFYQPHTVVSSSIYI